MVAVVVVVVDDDDVLIFFVVIVAVVGVPDGLGDPLGTLGGSGYNRLLEIVPGAQYRAPRDSASSQTIRNPR